MADDKKKPKDEAGKDKPKAPKKEEKPKDDKKPKDEKKDKPKDDKKKKYDPNAGAVKGTEIDPETNKALDPHKAAAASGGKNDEEHQKELHRHDDDRVPHPLTHEEQGSQPVVDGTVTTAGGAPGQPTEPTVPGQDQQVPSQPKVVDALGGGVPVTPDSGVTGHGTVNKSPGESGPTGKLPIA